MLAIASDHGGYNLKEHIKAYLAAKGITCKDFGTDSEASCDYPDYAAKGCAPVVAGEVDYGVLVCGTGIGMAIAACKIDGIRAANVNNTTWAELCREHNDANVIVLPGRFITPQKAIELVDTFFHTDFLGGRHQRRINKIPLPQK